VASGLVGLLVNPVAGIGGRVGLHGSDGPARLAAAAERGGTPVSPLRAARALRRLRELADAEILTAPGPMGADVAEACGIPAAVAGRGRPSGQQTTAADTQAAATLLAAQADVLLFAGGDGTARDIAAAVGLDVPLVGIPSGVKMRSGVFAASPEAAAELTGDFLGRPGRPRSTAEILDASADGLRTEFHGVAVVPADGGRRLTGPKSSGLSGSPAELRALCAAVAADLVPGPLYLFGPGTTTGGVLEQLGLPSTPLGVDAVRDGALVGADLPEQGILALMDQAPVTRLVLGVIGGQGFLLGRGNQQLSPAVLARLRPGDLWIVAAAGKLLPLDPPVLLADIGDEAAFRGLSGYHRVRVGPARYMMMQVAAAA
jgi:predicted polyphosphate/ATP-dependent NAD kinase